MMNLSALALLLIASAGNVFSFTPGMTQRVILPPSTLQAASSDEGQMKESLEQEAMNAATMKEAAEQMKSMKPEDIESMIREMDNMPAAEVEQLKSMGMDPEVMKSTMEMMKNNPEMMKTMGDVMSTMTPEELIEQSRLAQENIKAVTNAPETVADAEVVGAKSDDDTEDEEGEPIEPDQKVLDAMFSVAEIMSNPIDGGTDGVTFQGFVTIPPVVVLSGIGEDDLTMKELTDCWNKGSLGNTRVDRAGFERVWRLIQENYYSDIVDEAQERMQKRKRGGPKTTPATNPIVGSSVTADQLQQQLKNMKDEDMAAMFDRMSNMTPEDEQRMKAMGVDPAMMKKSAEMMKSNPLFRKAATTMMKNTSPEQMIKASQEAQAKMANMSEEEKKQMMDNLK